MQESRMKKFLHLIILSFILSCITGIVSASTERPAAEKQLALDIYKQFIEIPSGFSTGSTTPVAEAAAARLEAAGFPKEDIFIGGASPNKANLVVRYHGTGQQKPILLLAHIDVVEAKRADWSTDPFKFTARDGYFYGRGTSDDKAQAAVWVANLIAMKKQGFKPDRDIIVALTADEEGDSPYNGVEWLLAHHRNLIDAELALNEGGWGEIIHNKKITNNIQVSEKYVVNFEFSVHNKGGHSSLPVADNAIYRLADALKKLSTYSFPLKINDVTSAYFAQMAKSDSNGMRADLLQVTNNSQEAMKRVAAASPAWNATLRTTCVPTLLSGGHAVNALPQLAVANVNCRVLPDESIESVQKTLENVVADNQVSIKVVGDFGKGPASPLRPDLIKAVSEVTDSMWPGVLTTPIMVMGATDGRYLRAAGIPTYGVQGFFVDLDDVRAHGKDERMSEVSFYEGQAFLYDLVKKLSTSAV
jgi:acetylornithine deacetylase/succinyl-diaminopimelate desuccinylase-like protein